MKLLTALILAISSVVASQTAIGSEHACVFSSIKDFMADNGAVFAVNGIKLDFRAGVGSNAYRAFEISPCSNAEKANCFTAAYFSFGVPESSIAIGDSWIMANETYTYEQNIETKILGRSESFGVITRSIGGKVKSKFLVNETRGLGAILFFNDEGRADYQLYLQGDACRPFPITLRKTEKPGQP